jgi:hypothetical protein
MGRENRYEVRAANNALKIKKFKMASFTKNDSILYRISIIEMTAINKILKAIS